MTRQYISKKLRFEVFKRDAFTCQYCGQRAPDVVLQCDHVNPVAAGGSSDILNLATSCVACNAGKGARSLSDKAALTKQLDQLEELQARREQIEMLIAWREELTKLNDDVVDKLEERWVKLIEGAAALTPTGRDTLRKLVKRHGVELVLEAMEGACKSYLCRDADHVPELDSINRAFNRIGSVANVLRRSKDKPYLRQLFYIRGILRKRLDYVHDLEALRLMERCAELDIDIDWLTDFAKSVRSWSQFRATLEGFITSQEAIASESDELKE